jgi:hypothetical protein
VRWPEGRPAPPRCGDCCSHSNNECWHGPKCPVCGFILLLEWCSGCDAMEQPTADLLEVAQPLPEEWDSRGWNTVTYYYAPVAAFG